MIVDRKRSKQITTRFRRVFKGSGCRLYWQHNRLGWKNVFEDGDIAVLKGNGVTIHFKTLPEIEEWITIKKFENFRIAGKQE